MRSLKYRLVILSIILLAFVSLYPQNAERKHEIPVDEITGLITYQEVIQTAGSRQELYNRAIAWVNSFYVNPTNATKVRSLENGIIEILHRFKISNELEGGVLVDAGMISYSLKIELRDDRYRYTMNNFTLRQASRFPVERWLDKSHRAYNPNWDIYLQQVNEFARNLVLNLIEAMKPEEKVEEDEW